MSHDKPTKSEVNLSELNEEGRKQWNKKAGFWDHLHGDDGNTFHRSLVEPSVLELVAIQSGETVLDIACGNGTLARKLSSMGAVVTACDFSEELIKLAQGRDHSGEKIDYQVVDATDEDALVGLRKNSGFDAITCTMALQDIAIIAPMFRAVRRLLAPAGRFVLALSHPCFNSTNPKFVASIADEAGEEVIEHAMQIKQYFGIQPVLAVGASGEPSPHYFYHRTLQELLTEAFEAGLAMNGLLEPTFSEDLATPKQLKWWVNTSSIPPVLTARLVKLHA